MDNHESLSERELEVLDLVATGAGNKEIAELLSISTNTVKVHLRNIFGKLGVASRTEAALYGINSGLIGNAYDGDVAVGPRIPSRDGVWQDFSSQKKSAASRIDSWTITLGLIGILLISIVGMLILLERDRPQSPPKIPENRVITGDRWETKAQMPSPRSGIAAVVFDNQIYAIGGETEDAVSAAFDKYDPISDAWTRLPNKPLAVSDVNAVTVAGKFFIPGGRTGSGKITNVVETYDSQTGEWGTVEPLPRVVSRYAISVFEGKIYLFGGWDGIKYIADVLEYDPADGHWRPLSPMPLARADAGAVVSGNSIYVVGGINDQGILSRNDIYSPLREGSESSPWQEGAPLPSGRYAAGIASVANIIYVIGGMDSLANGYSLKYSPVQDEWQTFTMPEIRTWLNLTVSNVETNIYIFGGKLDGTLTNQMLSYRAVYTILLPQVQ